MQKVIYTLSLLFILGESVLAQKTTKKTDKQLSIILDTVFLDDQKYRKQEEAAGQKYGWQSAERYALKQTVRQKDSLNQLKIAGILDEYGWLSPARIGKQGQQTLILVLNHANWPFQQKYLPLMRDAADKKLIDPHDLAWLEDRVLVKQGKKQLYGTQSSIDMETGNEVINPIEDPEHVNDRRAKLGLGKLEHYMYAEGIEEGPDGMKPEKIINPDTLRLIVLSPDKVEVAADCLKEYKKLKEDLLKKRAEYKKQKKQLNEETYAGQPPYMKRMSDNEIGFYDSLSLDNYISMVTRGYMDDRLYDPFEIEPRLVFVVSKKSASDLKAYKKLAGNTKNTFIINFPLIKIIKENGELQVKTVSELYSADENKILLTGENTGLNKTGMTDYPICVGEGWDCAFVNSVYPNLLYFLEAISGKKIH